MPRYRRHFQTQDWIFLTIVTGKRRPWLRDAASKNLLINALRALKRRHPYTHLAHVILDDHMHWLLIANDGSDLPTLVSYLKRKTLFDRRTAGLCWRGLWQSRYYDHIIRDERDFRRHMDYIHYNPVRHGYVARASQYRWSSFNTWMQRGMYTPCWGVREPPGINGMNLE